MPTDFKSIKKKGINDGFFKIEYREDGVYLAVFPAVGKGYRVEFDEVLTRLEKKSIKGYINSQIEEIINKAERIPAKIAEFQEEAGLDAEVEVMITPDEMKAYINIIPPEGGRMKTLDEITSILKGEGIIFGIDVSAIENAINYSVYNEQICVAKGLPSVNGRDGVVKFHFDTEKSHVPTISEDGKVDFHELHLIQTVRKSEILCSLIPPENGINGKNIKGVDIPAENGKAAVIPKGKNAIVSEDGIYLLAGIDGQVEYNDGKVNVFSLYEIKGDVDNSTGNIDFIGNISIKGNVLSGFEIKAGGNVEIWGIVEGASIKAGGSIILRRGMHGATKGILCSDMDIVAKYIENSTIDAKRDIKAEAIMHSNVKCGNKLELSGRKGLLVGGICRVGNEITAKVIGSHLSTYTDVEVGVDPAIRERYKKVREEIKTDETDLKKAIQAIDLLRKLEEAAVLTEDKKEILAKSVRTRYYYENRLVELNEEKNELEKTMQGFIAGKIKCFDCVYPGTKITIGSSSIYVRDTIKYSIIYREGADIKTSSL